MARRKGAMPYCLSICGRRLAAAPKSVETCATLHLAANQGIAVLLTNREVNLRPVYPPRNRPKSKRHNSLRLSTCHSSFGRSHHCGRSDRPKAGPEAPPRAGQRTSRRILVIAKVDGARAGTEVCD